MFTYVPFYIRSIPEESLFVKGEESFFLAFAQDSKLSFFYRR